MHLRTLFEAGAQSEIQKRSVDRESIGRETANRGRFTCGGGSWRACVVFSDPACDDPCLSSLHPQVTPKVLAKKKSGLTCHRANGGETQILSKTPTPWQATIRSRRCPRPVSLSFRPQCRRNGPDRTSCSPATLGLGARTYDSGNVFSTRARSSSLGSVSNTISK
jgi:hypothetical protein